MAKGILGEMIAKYRKEARLTQEELGKMVGVSTQAVSRWECGGTPDVELLPVIADCLHVSVDALFGRDGGEAVDVKELIYRKIRNAPQESCMDLLLQYIWTMQQAALVNASPELEPALSMLPIDAVNRDGNESPQLVPASIVLCDERSYLLHGLVKDARFAAVLPEPEAGFESTLKRPEEYVKLFTLLAKPHALDMLIDMNRRKPKEHFTVRSAVARLEISEEEAGAILEELEHYMMIDSMEVADEAGTVKIYNLSADISLYAFLFFCQSVMRSSGEMQMNADIRKTPVFKEVPGTKSILPRWVLRGEDDGESDTETNEQNRQGSRE